VVELSAEAQREVPNDLLAATLYVEDSQPDAARLAAAINRVLGEALRVAREFPAVKVKSGLQHTLPVYAARGGALQGWRARAELRLESRDFAAASALIGRLQASMQLGAFTLAVAPETRRAVENELIAEAVAAFRARARVAQEALGGKGFKVQRIALSTSGYVPAPGPRVMAMQARSDGAATAPPVEAGASMVSVGASGAVEIE
jgi:predicted secreted protein